MKRPTHLPDCNIINALIEKADSKPGEEFKFIFHLDSVREKVSLEVSQINILFPEYTPHDENYHLKRLFFIADELLGKQLIDQMNSTELFLLSVSLYAHDWGMAVSEAEKQLIINCLNHTEKLDDTLLEDERVRVKNFCQDRRTKNIIENDWAEYVRRTHAFRSGKRIKDFFVSIDSGISEFVSRICEGHWLDFSELEDYTRYPINASILRESVNVKALSIYLRLIDLLDMGADRTPYILWKYVAPRNSYSKIEWNKHRSIQPVTFPPYQSTRIIQVDGSTADQEVFMSIMDFKRYVNDQFRECSDLLSRINHSYHKLDISHIEWRIVANGFEPIPIQFEFQRLRMFEILGDEIYNGNPYVFLRELLQNSIDAIRLREELLKPKGISFLPNIEINIVEFDEYYDVQLKDNGLGMDSYIVKNYLSVAGRSFYQSNDFTKEQLKMDPISRFGIGVLSCFMVADYIEIETFRDPNTTISQEHLRITIPAKENYFKIEKNKDQFEIGTTFKVRVNKDKLPLDKNKINPIKFEALKYMRHMAGFVEIPIRVTNNGEQFGITKLSNSPEKSFLYPIQESILPQHIATVEEYFKSQTINIKHDLGLQDYDGCITHLLPISDTIDLINSGRSWPATEVTLIDYENELFEQKIGWKDDWSRINRYRGNSRNFDFKPVPYKVYMNGVLLENITPPELRLKKNEDEKPSFSSGSYAANSCISPNLVVNIPKPKDLRIDLARTNIESDTPWDYEFWEAYFLFMRSKLQNEVFILNDKECALHLGRTLTFYSLSPAILCEKIISGLIIPLALLKSGGSFDFKRVNLDELVKVAPRELKEEYNLLIMANFTKTKPYNGILKLWRGENTIIYGSDSYINPSPMSILNLSDLINYYLGMNYFLHSVEFISSALGDDFPLIQKILRKKEDVSFEKSLDLIISNIKNGVMTAELLHSMNIELKSEYYNFPIIVSFPTPYSNCASFGLNYLNIEHQTIKEIISICLKVIQQSKTKNLNEESIGKLKDRIKELHYLNYSTGEGNIKLVDFNSKINALFKLGEELNLTEGINVKAKFSLSDFVTNSVNKLSDVEFSPHHTDNIYKNGKKDWGKPIKS